MTIRMGVTAAAIGLAVASSAPAMDRPEPQVGDTAEWLVKSEVRTRQTTKKIISKVVAVDERTVTYEQRHGGTLCTVTELREMFILPLREGGRNCRRNVERTVTSVEGKIWPLQVGRKLAYRYTGKNSKGKSWREKIKCEVKRAGRVTVSAGAFNAYQVSCDSRTVRKTYYVAPELGIPVKYREWKFEGSGSTVTELLSYSGRAGE